MTTPIADPERSSARKVVGTISHDRVAALQQAAAMTSLTPGSDRTFALDLGDRVPHALVVEDDHDLLELLGVHMRRLGCSVTLVASAKDALAAVEVQVPDFIVLDIELPDMDGRHLMASFRNDGRTTSCPVVITSVVDPEEFLAAGDSVLAKPFDRSDVDRVLRPLLGTLTSI